MVRSLRFNNTIIEHSVHHKRNVFIEEVRSREAEILQLASLSCNKASSSFFQSPVIGDYVAQGSYNLCFFIEFSEGEKCVLRIPLRPCLGFCPGRKIKSEVATMRYVAQNTTIPIPKILAYSSDVDSNPLSTFIILDYIDGKMLSSVEVENLTEQQRQELYASLADFYIQLRRLEFPSIGRIEETPRVFEILQKTNSIDMNMQELERLKPFAIQDSYHDQNGLLRSANAYTTMLLDIGSNAFFNSRSAVSAGMGRDALYHHWLFYRHAKNWVDPALDGGPFVLVHGDLHPSNLIMTEQMRISGVLDWEWSRVTPVQFFMPPLWLSGRNTVELAGHNTWQLFLKKYFQPFLSILEAREMDMFGNALLAHEWAERSTQAEPLVANALENWTDMDWFAFRYLSRGGGAAMEKAINDFMDEDPMRRLIAKMKEQEESTYRLEAAAATDSQSPQHKQPLLLNLYGKIHGILHVSPKASILGMVALFGLSLFLKRPGLNPKPQGL